MQLPQAVFASSQVRGCEALFRFPVLPFYRRSPCRRQGATDKIICSESRANYFSVHSDNFASPQNFGSILLTSAFSVPCCACERGEGIRGIAEQVPPPFWSHCITEKRLSAASCPNVLLRGSANSRDSRVILCSGSQAACRRLGLQEA